MQLKRGDDWVWECQVTCNGQVQDMTGWTVSAEIRRPVMDRNLDGIGDVVLPDLVLDFGWRDATLGFASISANATATGRLKPGSYEIDMQLRNPAGLSMTSNTVAIRVLERVTGRGS
jgi:hypothetical protein